MATAKPRITVTLEKQRYELVRRLAAAQGQSRSAFMAELLEVVAPSLERVLVLMQSVQAAKGEVTKEMRGAAEKVVEGMDAHVAGAVRQLDLLEEALKSAQPPEEAGSLPRVPQEAAEASKPPYL